jgi:hypothetical protein
MDDLTTDETLPLLKDSNPRPSELLLDFVMGEPLRNRYEASKGDPDDSCLLTSEVLRSENSESYPDLLECVKEAGASFVSLYQPTIYRRSLLGGDNPSTRTTRKRKKMSKSIPRGGEQQQQAPKRRRKRERKTNSRMPAYADGNGGFLSKTAVEEATPEKALPIFKIMDRSINFDQGFAKCPSLYSFLRSWVQDDPSRTIPSPGLSEYSLFALQNASDASAPKHQSRLVETTQTKGPEETTTIPASLSSPPDSKENDMQSKETKSLPEDMADEPVNPPEEPRLEDDTPKTNDTTSSIVIDDAVNPPEEERLVDDTVNPVNPPEESSLVDDTPKTDSTTSSIVIDDTVNLPEEARLIDDTANNNGVDSSITKEQTVRDDRLSAPNPASCPDEESDIPKKVTTNYLLDGMVVAVDDSSKHPKSADDKSKEITEASPPSAAGQETMNLLALLGEQSSSSTGGGEKTSDDGSALPRKEMETKSLLNDLVNRSIRVRSSSCKATAKKLAAAKQSLRRKGVLI